MIRLALKCDATGVIQTVMQLDGIDSGEVVGRPLVAVLDPSSLVRGLQLLEDARVEKLAIGRELLVRQPNGPALLDAAAASDGDEILVMAAETRRDLWSLCSEFNRIPAAEKLQRALVGSRELGASSPSGNAASSPGANSERAVGELMRLYSELAGLDRELARRNAQLEQLSREKDRILGMAAHDLRSPLNAIALSVSFLDLELAEELDGVGQEVLARIRRSAEQMGRLIDDLLDIATVEHGGPVLKRALCTIEPLLREATQMHRLLAKRHDVSIELEISDDLPAVELDGDRLHQVLANLISNAVGHTPKNSSVTVRATRGVDHIAISVVDQGPGIDPDDLPHLFEPFRRGSGERRSGGSVGLGLTISRALVEAHGGTLEARNVPRGGAEFHFTLPAQHDVQHVAAFAAE